MCVLLLVVELGSDEPVEGAETVMSGDVESKLAVTLAKSWIIGAGDADALGDWETEVEGDEEAEADGD